MSLTVITTDGTEFTPPPKNKTRVFIIVGVLMILVLFGGLGTWAAVAELSSAAIAPGVVAVNSNWRTVQHLEGGIVDEILVEDGDHVERGDVLLRLDPTRTEASLEIINGQLALALATEARLLAERDNLDSISFPKELLDQKASDPETATILAGQELLFQARRASLDGQASILRQRIDQLDDQISGLQVQQSAGNRQIELIDDELEGLRQLYEEGYVTRSRILALERESERLRGERGEDLAAIARAETAKGESELQIIQLQKGFQEQVVAELRDIQSQIFDLEQRHVAAADQFDRVEIRAPESGTVLGMAAHTVGGVINPSEPIMHIVPDDDPLIIKARVRPTDIEDTAVGQLAEVRFSGLSQRKTPILNGEVATLSPDRLVDQQTGEAYYEARVVIPQEELDRLGDVDLLPGMPAEVMIKTGERTALAILLDPIIVGLSRSFKQQ
jgi:HlyD family secretion protein/epimerase transport system membrane fusion protein